MPRAADLASARQPSIGSEGAGADDEPVVISHKHRYLFVELPNTGTSAISKELRLNYDGVEILRKHSTYRDFLESASPDEKQFFVFSCIRNPLDIAVSRYFRILNDHGGWWSDPGRGSGKLAPGHVVIKRKFRFVQANEPDFAAFFLRYYRLPYNSWASLDHRKFDFIIRFESIADDFEAALELIGVEQTRPLPPVNVTADREKDFSSYYDSPAVVSRAERVFAGYMKEWGYVFPWSGDVRLSRGAQMQYEIWSTFLRFFWRHLRPWLWRQRVSEEGRRRLAAARIAAAGRQL
jgi:hypothetical protein